MDTVLSCLVTDSIGPGEFTERFIKQAKEVFGLEAGVALRSPLTALEKALSCLGLPSGAKVGLSPLAPIFHREAVVTQGYKPVYYDHDKENGALTWRTIASSGAAAAVLYYPFGRLPDPEEAASISIPLIEDMTEALGAQRKNQKAGYFANLALYAMEQGSLVTSGGGALLFAAKRRDAPIIRSLAERMPQENLLTDFNAALGFAQLKEFRKSFERRMELEAGFDQALLNTRHRTFIREDEEISGRYAYPILLECPMNEAIVHAKRNGVEAEAAFDHSILHGEFVDEDGLAADLCEGSRWLALRTIAFPLHERIGAGDARTISKVIATLP